jgi:hypothetical protein
MKQHLAQKRLREMKGASWRLRCQHSREAIENQLHKPLAYSSAADVVYRFIPDVVLTVGQENQDRGSIIHVSISCKGCEIFRPEYFCTFRYSSVHS